MALADVLTLSFKEEGFSVDAALDGNQGLALATSYAYDIIILDLMLPKLSGVEVLKAVRQRNNTVSILILSARGAVAERVKCITLGADDYLTKPFAFAELLVRVRTLLRRTRTEGADILTVGDLEIDRVARTVRRGTRRVELSAKEFSLLEFLVQNKGRVLSRTMIIEHVWDQSFQRVSNIVDVYIKELRKKLNDEHTTPILRTVRGLGYVVDDI